MDTKEFEQKPIAMMNGMELVKGLTCHPAIRTLVYECIKSVLLDEKMKDILEEKKNEERFTVKGINGIASIFGCSLPTAQKLKKTVIKDAVSQHGRLIITDVEKAKRLFKAFTDKNGTFASLPKV